ncbi:MAG: hypothetical protein OEW12_06125 [Deltaproteobacteria bacterium]|nr:hypothetical protein [Deltaproteobacteria bacterium]
MFDPALMVERLSAVLKILERIPRRFSGIKTADDFIADDAGIDGMDAICMNLIAVGEEIKQIDRKTDGERPLHNCQKLPF